MDGASFKYLTAPYTIDVQMYYPSIIPDDFLMQVFLF